VVLEQAPEVQEQKKSPFPTIREEEVALGLQDFLIKKKEEERRLNEGKDSQVKMRNNVKDNFTSWIVLGLVELIQTNTLTQLMLAQDYLIDGKQIPELQDYEQLYKVAKELGHKTECALFAVFSKDEVIDREYGKRFRDLLVGLKNDENQELRSNLVTGKVKPNEFVDFDKDKLCPQSLIDKREKR
jgi:hypothetical protein